MTIDIKNLESMVWSASHNFLSPGVAWTHTFWFDEKVMVLRRAQQVLARTWVFDCSPDWSIEINVENGYGWHSFGKYTKTYAPITYLLIGNKDKFDIWYCFAKLRGDFEKYYDLLSKTQNY